MKAQKLNRSRDTANLQLILMGIPKSYKRLMNLYFNGTLQYFGLLLCASFLFPVKNKVPVS